MKQSKLTCAHIKDSDQPAYPRSLVRVFDGRCMGSQGSNVSSGKKTKTLIRLCECADRFEFLLYAHAFFNLMLRRHE